jgi:hypothetical protein
MGDDLQTTVFEKRRPGPTSEPWSELALIILHRTPPFNLAHTMPPGAGESISFVGGLILFDHSVAISTAATAVFAGVTLILLLRQFAFSKPSIRALDNGGDSSKPYRMLMVKLLPPDDEKYFIHRISVCSPSEGSICRLSASPDEKQSWVRTIELEPGRSFENLRFKGPRGCIVKISVVMALSSDVIFKRRSAITIKMND